MSQPVCRLFVPTPRCWVSLPACFYTLPPIIIGVFVARLLSHLSIPPLTRLLLHFVRTMADQTGTRIDAIAKQLSDLKTDLQPVAKDEATLTSSVVSIRSELAAVTSVVASGLLKQDVHKQLDLPEEEISATFFLSAEPPPITETSVQWLNPADLVRSPSGVLLVTYVTAVLPNTSMFFYYSR